MSTGPASTFSADARVGEVLGGKYRLLRRIGEGGMGSVYEAQHLLVKRRFAIKVLHADHMQNEDTLARFKREAEAAGALESEHIVAALDFGTSDDGSPYLVMEYLPGESVGSLLSREGPLPAPRAISILLQVCRGLGVAHEAGIIHRDLKPDNLFVVRRNDASDRIKILDFGIAKLERPQAPLSATRTGSAIGTPFYMAPEQARGDKNVDRRVDIYALGVILYELLSGRKPHPGDSYNSILAHILTEPPIALDTLRPGLPAALTAAVHRALAFDASSRPASTSEFAALLSPFIGREVESADSELELQTAAASAPTLAPGEASAARENQASSTRERPLGHAKRWLAVAVALSVLAASAIGLGRYFLGRSSARAPAPELTPVAAAAPRAEAPHSVERAAEAAPSSLASAIAPPAQLPAPDSKPIVAASARGATLVPRRAPRSAVPLPVTKPKSEKQTPSRDAAAPAPLSRDARLGF